MIINKTSITPEACAIMIQKSWRIVAFTGAGISTAAGIPDFRGPNGIYTTGKYDPDLVFEIGYFRKHPEMFYEFSRDFITLLKNICPTYTHQFLARLENEKHINGIITQNIDALHHLAGSINIAELHGSFWTASCLDCHTFKKEGASLDWWEKIIQESPKSPVPACPICGGLIKPGVVFFNEPILNLDKSKNMVLNCDLLLVLGSSLTVYPAAFLPQITPAPIIVINQGEVALSSHSDHFFVNDDLDHFFKKVTEYIDS